MMDPPSEIDDLLTVDFVIVEECRAAMGTVQEVRKHVFVSLPRFFTFGVMRFTSSRLIL
jgi:hypothetical protein